MNNFLVFSSVGDSTTNYHSWLKKNEKFDIAIIYYGSSEETWEFIKKNATISVRDSGYVFPLLNKHFKLFHSYSQYLIIDDDIFVDLEEISNTFILMEKRKYSASSWSRNPKSHGFFDYAVTKNTKAVYRTNFIEQCLIFIAGDILRKFIIFCKTQSLGNIITGWDILFSNFAIQAGAGDLKILDFYQYYNPHPNEKTNGREIDRGNDGFEARSKPLKDFIRTNPDFFKMLPNDYWGNTGLAETIYIAAEDCGNHAV
jgi:hypothetical protein